MPGPASGGRNGPRPSRSRPGTYSTDVAPSDIKAMPKIPKLLGRIDHFPCPISLFGDKYRELRCRKVRRQRRGGLERVNVRNGPARLDQAEDRRGDGGAIPSGDRNGCLLGNTRLLQKSGHCIRDGGDSCAGNRLRLELHGDTRRIASKGIRYKLSDVHGVAPAGSCIASDRVPGGDFMRHFRRLHAGT